MIASLIVDICEARFGDSDNSTYTAGEWLEYVNDAVLEMSSAHPDLPFLLSDAVSVTVSSGQGSSTSLGSDVWRVRGVYNSTDKLPLAVLPGDAQYRRYFPDPGASGGIPLFYRWKYTAGSGVLEVYPYPTVTTTLLVDVVTAPAVVAGGAEPNIPEQHQRTLVLGALARAYEDDGNLPQAQHFQGRFERRTDKMLADLLSPNTEGFYAVTDNF